MYFVGVLGAGTALMTARLSGYHMLVKPTGAICNLDCEYCYYLSKEMLYPGSRFRMADDLLVEYLSQLLDSHRTPTVTVAWQGGEPTMMGLDFFRRSVEIVNELRRPHQTVEHTIQTNGVLIDESWAKFFKENGFLVGISVDGPKDVHDRYRLDKRGRGTFDRVMTGYRHLISESVDVNVLCTVHAENEDRGLDVYRFLRDDLGAEFIQFIPIVERSSETPLRIRSARSSPRTDHAAPFSGVRSLVTERSVSPQGYGQFLIEVFDEWVASDVGRVFVQMYDTALANWHGQPGGLCIHQETCGLALALEHNGDVYSCDHFVEPPYLLGNIRETPMADLVTSERQVAFGRAKRDALPPYCRSCDVRFMCHGGCPSNRFTHTPAGDPGLNYLCPSYTDFFRHVAPAMRIMSQLLNNGRAPAEITELGVPPQ